MSPCNFPNRIFSFCLVFEKLTVRGSIEWNCLFCSGRNAGQPGSGTVSDGEQELEAVEAKCVLCGGVGEDHVWVIQHVQAIQSQRVNF